MKRESFLPNEIYLIKNTANNSEELFYEEANYNYFLKLCRHHLSQVATLEAIKFTSKSFEMILRFHDHKLVPSRYKSRMHQPLANLFNAYAKGMNKTYGRSGSLFREHFKRVRIDPGKLRAFINSIESGRSLLQPKKQVVQTAQIHKFPSPPVQATTMQFSARTFSSTSDAYRKMDKKVSALPNFKNSNLGKVFAAICRLNAIADDKTSRSLIPSRTFSDSDAAEIACANSAAKPQGSVRTARCFVTFYKFRSRSPKVRYNLAIFPMLTSV